MKRKKKVFANQLIWQFIYIQDIYRLGSKWYFRACPELPNRKYKYRVYSLNSLDDVINSDLNAQEQFPEQTANPSVSYFLFDRWLIPLNFHS